MLTNRPPTTNVAIIGGGIMGASVAWHLAGRGERSVTLFERAVIASGASGRTGALLRQHYTNRPEAILVHASHQVYANWPEIVGGDCGFVPSSLVVTIETGPGHETNADRLRRNIAMQNEIGIDAMAISAAELKEIEPTASVDDLTLVAYEPTSGYVDAITTTRSMATAAIQRGVDAHENCPVQRILAQGRRVVGVETSQGRFAAGTVVIAAGPWTPQLLAPLSIDIPIEPIRVQVVILQRPLSMTADHLTYVDTVAGIFCRPWGPGRTLVGVAGGDQHDPADPGNFEQRNDRDYPAEAIAAISRRFPAMVGAHPLHGHAGLYDMTPDAHPIISATEIDGLYVMAGFSGAGFKKGPAVGQAMAELILDGHASLVDLTPFRLGRFRDASWQQPWSETEYIISTDFGHTF